MRICIFEDPRTSNLSPLNYFRHTSEIICGAFTLLEKISNYTGTKYKLSLHSRKYIRNYLKERFPHIPVNLMENDDYLFLNSRAVFSKEFLKNLLCETKQKRNFLNKVDENVIAFHLSSDKISDIESFIESGSSDNLLSVTENLNRINIAGPPLKFINYPWDSIKYHENEIISDLNRLFSVTKRQIKKAKALNLINSKDIYISSKSVITPNVVLDASNGKIFISDFVKIEPFAYIKGPVFIGKNSFVKSGSKIYGPVCIRENSKVSGEIFHSIIHSFVNKQHLGFLGNSYLCEWVNLGAGTTTSNLKNNYSEISVRLGEVKLNTETIFLGSIIGDHTKTGINTMLNSGTVIGISSNLFGGGFMPKLIRSFSWLDTDNRSTYLYEIEKALNTAKTTMSRRNITMTASYDELFRLFFKKTQEDLI